MMRTLFHRWWQPLLVFAAIFAGIYAYETWGMRGVNAALEIPLIPLLLIAMGMLYMLISLVYQLTLRRWLPAVITALALAWALDHFFV